MQFKTNTKLQEFVLNISLILCYTSEDPSHETFRCSSWSIYPGYNAIIHTLYSKQLLFCRSELYQCIHRVHKTRTNIWHSKDMSIQGTKKKNRSWHAVMVAFSNFHTFSHLSINISITRLPSIIALHWHLLEVTGIVNHFFFPLSISVWFNSTRRPTILLSVN